MSVKKAVIEQDADNAATLKSDVLLPELELNGSVAWAFAGQGSQVPGMGQDIYEQFAETQEIFESEAAGFSIKQMCFEATAEELANTRYTQACMAAFAAAVVRVLKGACISPAATLGLSLGEYSALHASGVFGVDELLALLAFRGSVMADASGTPSRMSAVLGLDDEAVEAVVAEVAASTGGVVSCTNYNSPGQIVIGGDVAAVETAEVLLKERGARRCMPLKTSGPFHTEFMRPAAKLLNERLESAELKPQQVPVIFNAIAAPAADSEICDLLTRQIYSPVRFSQSIKLLEGAGIAKIIEIGPGKVLAGLIRKTAPGIEVVSIENAEDLKGLIGS